MAIERFRGENFFLSNTYPLKNGIKTSLGIIVPSSEHAYQAEKFRDPRAHEFIANNARFFDSPNKPVYSDGYIAKVVAEAYAHVGIEIKPDFDKIKVGIMKSILFQKFMNNPELLERLLATGDQMLVEGNDWGDRFWGVDPVGSNDGKNHLGRSLMLVRDILGSTVGMYEGTDCEGE